MRIVVLDAHLLLLLVVGTSAPSSIGRHRRLRAYSSTDYRLLIEVLVGFDRILITPNVLTETSNLLGYCQEPMRTQLFRTFQLMIATFEESFVESRIACQRNEFLRLGLADASLLQVNELDVTLLTADLALYLAASKSKSSVVNFTHLREQAGTL